MAEAKGDKMRYFVKVFIVAVLNIFLFAGLSHAEKVTFVKEYTYQASELDSKASCRTISLEMVKRLLLEELGTYLISETEVKDFKLTKDQVKTYSAGIVGAEIIEDKWDGKTYWLKAKVSADPKEVQKSLKKIIDDKYQAKQLEDSRKKAEELTKEVERLKKELEAEKMDTKKPEQYNTVVQELSYMNWFEKGYALQIAEKHKEAIDAYKKALEINPKSVGSYHNIGLIYIKLGNIREAIVNYDKAIELSPQFAKAYMSRGFAYKKLGNFQQAIKDYGIAIKLDENVDAFLGRGSVYEESGDHKQANSDYNEAIKIDPRNVDAYIFRGSFYLFSDKFHLAIKDFDKAIDFNPTLSLAYNLRGLAYEMLGKEPQAIKDYKIAARLGDKKTQDYLKSKGIKW